MTNPHQSGAGQWIQSNGRQRQAFGGFFGLEAQRITVSKMFPYWPQWVGVDGLNGSLADQNAARKFYRTKTTDCTHILEGHSISFHAVERWAQGHCPQVTGMPGALVAGSLVHEYTGDDKNFSWTATGPRDDMLSVLVNESGPTLKRLVRQGTRNTANTSEDWRQELSEPEPLEQILGPIYANVRTRDWSAFPTSSAGTSDFSYWRGWNFDEYHQWPVDSTTDTKTLPSPSSFSEALTPNNQSGIVGGFGAPSLPYVPEKPSHNFDWIAERDLFSGWSIESQAASPGITAIVPRFHGVRSRFRINGRKAYKYFIARFRYSVSGVNTIISTPTLISSSIAYPGRIIEIPFFDTSEDAPGSWAGVGSFRLQIGEGFLAVIDETFQEWTARISSRIV